MRLWGSIFFLLPVAALAADPAPSAVAGSDSKTKVTVQADVVQAKVTGDKLEPPSLKAMQLALSKRQHYGTLVRLSTSKLELSSAPTMLKLPNAKEAALSVEALKDDVATVKVKLPPADTTYKLGRQGSLYVQAGPHDDGEMWLVLSPVK